MVIRWKEQWQDERLNQLYIFFWRTHTRAISVCRQDRVYLENDPVFHGGIFPLPAAPLRQVADRIHAQSRISGKERPLQRTGDLWQALWLEAVFRHSSGHERLGFQFRRRIGKQFMRFGNGSGCFAWVDVGIGECRQHVSDTNQSTCRKRTGCHSGGRIWQADLKQSWQATCSKDSG